MPKGHFTLFLAFLEWTSCYTQSTVDYGEAVDNQSAAQAHLTFRFLSSGPSFAISLSEV